MGFGDPFFSWLKHEANTCKLGVAMVGMLCNPKGPDQLLTS
jgi:hypothetical protein